MKYPIVTISRRGSERLKHGHLWIYRSDVADRGAAVAGGVVRVHDERGRFAAWALFSTQSEITLRVLTTQPVRDLDRDWWRDRLRAAIQQRVGLDAVTDAYRLIFSEGDLLSSLIVDKYGEVLVLQTLSQGMDALKPLLVELLTEELKPLAIVERNDVKVRQLEGLPMQKGILWGELPPEMIITQNGVKFAVAPLEGQKTGTFLDQRENHFAAQRFGRGRGLDCFTFNGGFALHLAKTCESVIGLDISADAVAACRRNATLNAADHVEFREVNVFDALHEFAATNQTFDTIVLDPPAFAKNRASRPAALRGYKEINLRALKMLSVGGVLISCTCSHHVSEGDFQDILTAAAADARRRVQIIEKRLQASDHPILLGVPETLYLKCLVLRVVE